MGNLTTRPRRRLLDPVFSLGGEGVGLFGAAVSDEALLDPGAQLLLLRGPGIALRDRAVGALECCHIPRN